MIGDQWSSLAKTTGTDSLNDTHSIEEDLTFSEHTKFCSARGSKLCPPDQESGALTKGLASWDCLGCGRLLYRAVTSMLLLMHAVSLEKFRLL